MPRPRLNIQVLAALLTELSVLQPVDPTRKILLDRGWVPLGADCTTGREGWGKVIDGRAVTLDQSEALALGR